MEELCITLTIATLCGTFLVFLIILTLLSASVGIGRKILESNLNDTLTLVDYYDDDSSATLTFEFSLILSGAFLLGGILSGLSVYLFYSVTKGKDNEEYFTFIYQVFLRIYLFLLSFVYFYLFSEIADVNLTDVYKTSYFAIFVVYIIDGLNKCCLSKNDSWCLKFIVVQGFGILTGYLTYLLHVNKAEDRSLEDLDGSLQVCLWFGFCHCSAFIPFIPSLMPLVIG